MGSGGALRLAFKQDKDLGALRVSLPCFCLIQVFAVVASLAFDELFLESKEASFLPLIYTSLWWCLLALLSLCVTYMAGFPSSCLDAGC